eukprot:UN5055
MRYHGCKPAASEPTREQSSRNCRSPPHCMGTTLTAAAMKWPGWPVRPTPRKSEMDVIKSPRRNSPHAHPSTLPRMLKAYLFASP